jgi:hypothetical protein
MPTQAQGYLHGHDHGRDETHLTALELAHTYADALARNDDQTDRMRDYYGGYALGLLEAARRRGLGGADVLLTLATEGE